MSQLSRVKRLSQLRAQQVTQARIAFAEAAAAADTAAERARRCAEERDTARASLVPDAGGVLTLAGIEAGLVAAAYAEARVQDVNKERAVLDGAAKRAANAVVQAKAALHRAEARRELVVVTIERGEEKRRQELADERARRRRSTP